MAPPSYWGLREQPNRPEKVAHLRGGGVEEAHEWVHPEPLSPLHRPPVTGTNEVLGIIVDTGAPQALSCDWVAVVVQFAPTGERGAARGVTVNPQMLQRTCLL